ncbi:MAG: COG1361 S-layer family protein [Planctomycetota bacterium]|jgi:uncharacterized repeat protein (TIGR01451 family)
MPHSLTWPASGDVVPSHPEPPEGGYYSNWDPYAVKLEVTPIKDINPVRTQHIMVATVLDADGEPLPNRRVEWIISEGSVGDIIEVDESGWRASRGYIVGNDRAVSHTNNYAHVLDRGTDDPSDDIHLTPGQTWCVITSPIEGTTNMVVYAPGIYNWEEHKVFVVKHWYDVAVQFPPEAINRVGTPHQLTTCVTRHSDGTPLAGYEVTYCITGGPDASLSPGGGQTATVLSDANGMATVTLNQAAAVEGVNVMQIDVVRPGNEACCTDPVHIATGTTRKTWLAPKIAITKSAPASAIVGDTFMYSMTVSNPSRMAADNVTVVDELPSGMRYVSSSPAAQVSGQRLMWSLGTLAGGASQQLSVNVEATQTGQFTNCATVTADLGLVDEDCADTVVCAPALAIEKSAPAEVLICDPIEYVFVVRNTGNAPATNVRLEDNLPDGLTGQNGQSMVVSNIGTLAAGQAMTVRFQARANRTGDFNNTATVTADRGLTAQASARVVVREPVLALTKTGPALRYLNTNVTYQLTVRNTGDVAATNTVLVDSLPAGARFVEASDGGQLSGGQVRWNLGTMAVGGSQTVSVTFQATQVGTMRNSASVSAYCAQATAEATTEVQGIPAVLLECVDQQDPVEVGGEETYTITVTNQGSAEGTNIVIVCTLPAEETFVSAGGPAAHSAQGQTVRFEPLGSLAAGARATYTVVVRGTAAGDVRFRVDLTSDQIDEPVMETESTRFYE